MCNFVLARKFSCPYLAALAGRDWSCRRICAAERGWRATFYTTGMEHSPTSATGAGWERTPWHATQRAASMPASTGEEVAPSAPVPAFLAGFAYAIGATPRGSSKSPLGSDAR
jgi:hypothetical protein